MLQQHLLFERVDIDCRALLASNTLTLRAAEKPVQHRQRDKNAVAVAGETLRLDDRPSVRRRRDIGVGHFFVPQRLRHQQRRIGPERGVDIPARQVAAGNVRAAAGIVEQISRIAPTAAPSLSRK